MPYTGWFKLAVIYGIAMVIMLLISFFGCKEHIGVDGDGNAQVEKVPFNVAFPALLKNKYFYLQALLFMVLYIGSVAQGTLGYYFYNNVLGNLAIMSLVSTIPSIVSNIVTLALAQRFGKRKIMMAGLIVKGFGSGPIMSGVFALTADVVDYGEWKTGVRSEGLVNSCTSFGMKVGISFGAAVGSAFLSVGGYDGTVVVQSAPALNAIRFGFGYFGVIFSGICLVIIFAMNIAKYIKGIQKDLEAKHNV